MAEEEIGDKGGGTISDVKSVNIVNEDTPSLDKDFQLTTALEKTESLVSTRTASLVGLRRMMFENISHTDDEKLPKLRKMSFEKSFQESQKKCDIKSDFSVKDSSENNSDSVKLNESVLVQGKNEIVDDSLCKQSSFDRRYSKISFIDSENDHNESVLQEDDKDAEKNALVENTSIKNEESESNDKKPRKETFVDIPDTIPNVDVSVILLDKSDDLNEQLEKHDELVETKNCIVNNDFIDDKVNDDDDVIVETKNTAIEVSNRFVEAKNDVVCNQLIVEATNDVVCDTFSSEESGRFTKPTELSLNVETAVDIPIPPTRGKTKDKSNAQSTPVKTKQPFSPSYPESLNPFGEDDEVHNKSTNPFGSSDDEDEKNLPTEAPTPHTRKLISAPKISLNPFGSDSDEDCSDDEDTSSVVPVPMPRSLRTPEPSPLPRSKLRSSRGSLGSATSLASRKKKPAPLPPSLQSPGTRKARQAPLPPPVPRNLSPLPPPLPLTSPPSTPPSSLPYIPSTPPSLEKNDKDFVNRQRQNSETSSISSYTPNKSTYGQWKRKKGPAPARPIPQRRFVKPMPIKEIRQELDDIEIKQQELERQGVKLEQTIRDKFEHESSLTPYVEEMVLQLFELVNEKNELFRRQAELMYLRRQHNLEEEHAELEYQIRCLMLCPDHNKTDSDKAREEELIHRLVEVVERRDEIIQCLEMDRLREAEEDRSVNTQLGIFSAAMGSELDLRVKSGKKEKKNKKEKKVHKKDILDVDKDIDEMDKERKKHKKKWFTLHHKT